MTLKEELLKLKDEEYKRFHEKLVPELSSDRIIGVRAPDLKRLSKSLPSSFLTELPHYYFEENKLHAYAIERIKDTDECLKATDAFLPFVDNWAVCDGMSPPAFKKDPEKVLKRVEKWLFSNHPFTVRYGIKTLMTFFSDELFDRRYLEWVAGIKPREYYVLMMQAWYFATLLAKRWDEALPYIENKVLTAKAHNKAIQKAVESLRISPERKAYLRSLKV